MASGCRVGAPLCVALLLLAASGCGASDTRKPKDVAPELRDVTVIGRLTDPELTEASGLVPSTDDPNLFWAQNDSGHEPQLFAFDSTGRALGIVRVQGARNRDWEAISSGPCDQGTCMYVGDVGDNGADRKAVRVWRIPTPKSNDTLSTTAEQLTLRYSDGPRDVESMWVAPDTAVYLLSKRPERDASGAYRPVRIYRVPPSAWRSADTATAMLVDSLPIFPTRDESRTWVTDAALSRRDSLGAVRLAVRSYNDLYIFGVDTTTWRPAALVAQCSLRGLKERNSGEGLAWLPDGRLMFDAEGKGSRLHTGRCP